MECRRCAKVCDDGVEPQCPTWCGGLQNCPVSEPQLTMLEHLQFMVGALKEVEVSWNMMFFNDGTEAPQGECHNIFQSSKKAPLLLVKLTVYFLEQKNQAVNC